MSRLNSKLACEWSVERLADPHLWTFTLPVVLLPREAARMWQKLQRDLVRSLGMYGVRVFEAHPGGHGLHVHMVVSGRYDVNKVRAICLKHGWGRINVIRVSHPGYVAKYLTKSSREDGWKWRGLRLWAVLGKKLWPSSPTRVLDVVSQNAERQLYNRLKKVVGGVSDFREARRLYMCADWLLAGLLTVQIERQTFDGVPRRGLSFHPTFETCAFERCVFWRPTHRATHPAREEEWKGAEGPLT